MSLREAIFLLRDATFGAGTAFRSTIVRVCLSCCTVLALVWVAVMMYVSFYYAYMPTVRHAEPVYLQFSSDCETEICSYPEANVSLSKGERILMRGLKYQVFLDLEMPHSPVNEKLGMFMVNVKFYSSSGSVVAKSSRSSMLHFKSGLHQMIYTVFMSFPLMFGFSEEKQIVPVRLFENYVDDSYHPAVTININIAAKHIEFYSASLRIEAQFTGLRHILFAWPATSALVIITANFIVVSFIFFFAYTAFVPEPSEDICRPLSPALAVTTSPSNARRRFFGFETEPPQASRQCSPPSRTGRSKTIHKRPRMTQPDSRNVSSTSRDKSSPDESSARGFTRPDGYLPFRWRTRAAHPSQHHTNLHATVRRASGEIGRGGQAGPGGLPVVRNADNELTGGGPVEDVGRGIQHAGIPLDLSWHRGNRGNQRESKSRTLTTSRSMTDARFLLENTHDNDRGTPMRTRSEESLVWGGEATRPYIIIDPDTGKHYTSFAAYQEDRIGLPGKASGPDKADDGSIEPEDVESHSENSSVQDGGTTIANKWAPIHRVPDGADGGSASSLNGPAGTSNERAEFGSPALRKRSLKRSRQKIGLSFRKMLSLR